MRVRGLPLFEPASVKQDAPLTAALATVTDTGIAMVLVGRMPITTPWLLVAFALYVLVVLVGMLGYTPTLKEQIRLLASAGFDSNPYRAAARRGTVLGVVLAALVVSIIFFMVVKPVLKA